MVLQENIKITCVLNSQLLVMSVMCSGLIRVEDLISMGSCVATNSSLLQAIDRHYIYACVADVKGCRYNLALL